jgi:hypothetical protein
MLLQQQAEYDAAAIVTNRKLDDMIREYGTRCCVIQVNDISLPLKKKKNVKREITINVTCSIPDNVTSKQDVRKYVESNPELCLVTRATQRSSSYCGPRWQMF